MFFQIKLRIAFPKYKYFSIEFAPQKWSKTFENPNNFEKPNLEFAPQKRSETFKKTNLELIHESGAKLWKTAKLWNTESWICPSKAEQNFEKQIVLYIMENYSTYTLC